MFFTVKHGADEHVLFNPDCSLKLLVDSIRKRCNVPWSADVALADEKFAIINFAELTSDNYCSSIFPDRGVYTLLAIYKRETGPPKYKPLLDTVDPDLAMKLQTLSNPTMGDPRTLMKAKSRFKSVLQPSRVKKRSASVTGKTGKGK